jgi:predicted enzyme related to lactoylglutathione lyase
MKTLTTSENFVTGVFCWNALMTPRTQEAAIFYTKLLGWKRQIHEVGEMTYAVFVSEDKAIEGMLQTL